MKRLSLFLSLFCAVLLVQVSPVFAADTCYGRCKVDSTPRQYPVGTVCTDTNGANCYACKQITGGGAEWRTEKGECATERFPLGQGSNPSDLPSCRGTNGPFGNQGTNREACKWSDGSIWYQCIEGTVSVTEKVAGGYIYHCVQQNSGVQPTPIPNSICQTNGSFCRYVIYDTSAVTLKVGETKTIKVSGFISSSTSDGPVGAVKFMSSNVNSVAVGPSKKASYSKNICCEFVYGRHNDTVTIYGVAPGKSIITTQYYKQNATAPGCSNKCLTVTVIGAGEETPTPSPTATPSPIPTSSPLTCDLEVRWTSTGDLSNWKYGDMVTFYADAVPNDRVPTGASVRYEGEVGVYRGNTPLKGIVLVPQTAGSSRFNAIKIDETGARYYFKFRYCLIASDASETCSDWGNPQLPGGSETPTPTVEPSPTPTTHTVKFVNKVASGRSSMVVDAIKDGVVYVENNNSKLTYSGRWTTTANASSSGGSYAQTSTNGDAVTFTTSASTISYRTYRYPNRSDVEVYVDGVLKTTLTGLNVGRGWVDLPITL